MSIRQGSKLLSEQSNEAQAREAALERHQQRMETERAFSKSCRDWLDHNQITKPGMTQGDRMKAMAPFRNRVKADLLNGPSDTRAWAFDVVSRIADGEIYSAHAETMARDVVAMGSAE